MTNQLLEGFHTPGTKFPFYNLYLRSLVQKSRDKLSTPRYKISVKMFVPSVVLFRNLYFPTGRDNTYDSWNRVEKANNACLCTILGENQILARSALPTLARDSRQHSLLPPQPTLPCLVVPWPCGAPLQAPPQYILNYDNRCHSLTKAGPVR